MCFNLLSLWQNTWESYSKGRQVLYLAHGFQVPWLCCFWGSWVVRQFNWGVCGWETRLTWWIWGWERQRETSWDLMIQSLPKSPWTSIFSFRHKKSSGIVPIQEDTQISSDNLLTVLSPHQKYSEMWPKLWYFHLCSLDLAPEPGSCMCSKGKAFHPTAYL